MPSRLKTVIELLHTAGELSLASHSVSITGYPFATSLNYITDEHHRPILLMSRLAEHTQCVLADSRAGAVVARTVGDGEIARASFVGDVVRIEPSPSLVERYLRYHPAAQRFLQLGDFHFYRFEPKRIRVVGGFAQAGWLDGKQLLDAPSIPLTDEANLINSRQPLLPDHVTLLGVDAYGVDYVQAGIRQRTVFNSGPVVGEVTAAALSRLLAKL
jgi:hypothetical protein